MSRTLIFGNSGAGKSTLAKRLCARDGAAHLDLDTLAWQATTPPTRKPLVESVVKIRAFVRAHHAWVIEGCYTDLLEEVIGEAEELVFLDLPVNLCQDNARARPWEPHKYASKAAQDANLEMLLAWIAEYEARDDGFSRTAHRRLFDGFARRKSRLESNSNEAQSLQP